MNDKYPPQNAPISRSWKKIKALRRTVCRHRIRWQLHDTNEYSGASAILVYFQIGKEHQSLEFRINSRHHIELPCMQPQECVDLLRAINVPVECFFDSQSRQRYSFEHEQMFEQLYARGIIEAIESRMPVIIEGIPF